MNIARREWLAAMGVGTAASAIGAVWLDEHVVRSASAAESTDASLRILYNENPLGCSPKARDALQSTPTQLYGFTAARQLINTLRLRHQLGPLPTLDSLSVRGDDSAGEYSLALGVGSSELLKALAQACCKSGGSVVESDPSYRAVGRAAQAVHPETEVRRIALQTDGSMDLEAMAAAVTTDTRIVVLTNPNNPTGGVTPLSKISAFVDATPDQTIVLIDEAYIDFIDEGSASAMPLARSKRNVLVTRTFSKLHGLAGLRLGYGVAHSDLIERMKPYMLGLMGINCAATAACLASLKDEAHQAKTRTMVKAFNAAMQSTLPKLGFHVMPSSAPFVWADYKHDATDLVQALAADGVLISGGQRWDRPRAVRISATDQCERLQAALKKAVA